ncbi:GNAT family N-acetyltransferase [Paenibacillus athensensis]|uniref:GNAT family N-acetyltransferase n=1 Tax=Paenibacillus athensensis TaxID=1967502 RepID=A0A4Y8Q7X6_9BACL|nr:GNAT family protein [Paenibacillus athensensis]MCD1260238.1 GNAT family N-acetyltransferase [Paenibacillus athensensis]
MNQSPKIVGTTVTLRQPIEQDIYDYLQCEVKAELEQMYGGDTRNMKPRTLEMAQSYIERIRGNKLNWCVEYEGRSIGEARLTVNEEDRRARYAVGIFDASCWNQGLGTEITRLVLAYAFEELRLHRVDLRVLEYNTRAIRCYEKCGFVIEGREREGALIEGRFETDVIMSILEQEYRAAY